MEDEAPLELQTFIVNSTKLSEGQLEADGGIMLLRPVWSLALWYPEVTSSPGFPILVYFVTFILCQLPCTVSDLIATRWSSVSKYKIQKEEASVGLANLKLAAFITFWNNLLYIVPFSVAQWAWMSEISLPEDPPTVWQFCWHQYLSLVIVDCEYYIWHYLHHRSRFLYRHVHSFHHQFHSVNSWVTQYSHPWELFSLGFFTTTTPWLLDAHPLTCWSFLALMLAVSVEDHSGYDLPIISPHHWAPFWGGSLKHDMHHQRPLTNFQPFFNWFDRLFGHEYPSRSNWQACESFMKLMKRGVGRG